MGVLEEFPLPRHFCCCLSLRRGTFLFAVLDTILGVVAFGGGVFMLVAASSTFEAMPIAEETKLRLMVFGVLLTVLSLPMLALAVLLLRGVIKEDPSYIHIWLWIHFILGNVILFLGILLMRINRLYTGVLLSYPIRFYLWLCVNSYYHRIR